MNHENYSDNPFYPWKVIGQIGRGALGEVLLVVMENADEYRYGALKIFPADRIRLPFFHSYLKQEHEWLFALDESMNLVKNLAQQHYSIMKDQEWYYLVFEYCPGGSLEQLRLQYPKGIMSPSDVFLCFEQIVRGMRCAHEKDLIHGNLCAENILLVPPNKCKISDLGLFRIGTAPLPLNRLLYQSPETLYEKKISRKSDVWSAGVLAYHLLTGDFPFQGVDEEGLFRDMESHEIAWPESMGEANPASVEGSLVYLVRQMLSLSPQRRPDIKEISNAVQRCHKMITPYHIDAFEKRLLGQIQWTDKRPSPSHTEGRFPAPPEEGISGYVPSIDLGEGKAVEGMPRFYSKEERERIKNTLKKGLSGVLAISLISLFFTLYFHGFISLPEKFGIVEPKKIFTLSFQVFPELPLLKFTFSITQEERKELLELNDVEIVLHYHHAKGREGVLPPSRPPFEPFFWEIPVDMPDGKLTIWAQLKSGDAVPPLASGKVEVEIVGLFEDRQEFFKAQQAERLFAHDPARYETIVEAYEQYCKSSPEGYFKKEALKKLQIYKPRGKDYWYEKLRSLVLDSPDRVEEIVSSVAHFTQKYASFPEALEIREIEKYYQQLMVPSSYPVRLIDGHIKNRFLKADCYVKVYSNQKLIWNSPVIKDNNDPVWNASFFVTWKIKDEIRVELWDKNVAMIADKLYFSVTDNSVFSLLLLNQKIEKENNWIRFGCDFPKNPMDKK